MANIKNNYSDYVRFYLTAKDKPSLLVTNVVGWQKHGLDAARDLISHGGLVKVSGKLGFSKEARDYIDSSFSKEGILCEISLIVSYLKDTGSKVQWVPEEPVYADFETYQIKDNLVYLNFYSNSLLTLIQSHEDDEFELERLESIDNKIINPISEDYITMKGRSLKSVGRFKLPFGGIASGGGDMFWRTNIITEGPSRHSQADYFFHTDFNSVTASSLFYDNSVVPVPTVTITLDYDIDLTIGNGLTTDIDRDFFFSITKVKFDTNTNSYSLVERYHIAEILNASGGETLNVIDKSSITITLNWDEGLAIDNNYTPNESGSRRYLSITKGEFTISEVEYYEESPSVRFLLFHDVLERLMYILTGFENRFFSSFLGRTEKGYIQDGYGAFIGFLSGLWVRNFTAENQNYKSPKISLKDSLSSISNCFNLGYGVESIDGIDKLVLEELNYFYRQEIVGKFPFIVKDFTLDVDKKLFYSRLEFGYEKSGGIDQEMGLDEPNVKSQFITPLKLSVGKFIKKIKIRADEYKLETLRRKPYNVNPDEQLSGDEDNWFLDLKRNLDEGFDFKQVSWQDRLSEEPQGIHDPESFTSMIFTPMRILHRTASNFKSGFYLYKDKFVNFISSSSNRNLHMKFIGESNGYKESDNVKVGDLSNPIFKNKTVKFTHPWSEDLDNLIFGKTEIIVNGQQRLVPNYYFKMEFKNNEGNLFRGYYLKHEHGDNPTFEFQLANEEII